MIDLLNAMTVSEHIQDPRELFYTIITSRCPTTIKKYHLYDKALKVQLKTEPRKSRLRRSSSSSQLLPGKYDMPLFSIACINASIHAYNVVLMLTEIGGSFLTKIFQVRANKRPPLQPIEKSAGTSSRLTGLGSHVQQSSAAPDVKVFESPRPRIGHSRSYKFSNPSQKRLNDAVKKRKSLNSRSSPPKKIDLKSTPPKTISSTTDQYVYHKKKHTHRLTPQHSLIHSLLFRCEGSFPVRAAPPKVSCRVCVHDIYWLNVTTTVTIKNTT